MILTLAEAEAGLGGNCNDPEKGMVAGTRVLASSRGGKKVRPVGFADGSDMGCERYRGQGISKVLAKLLGEWNCLSCRGVGLVGESWSSALQRLWTSLTDVFNLSLEMWNRQLDTQI